MGARISKFQLDSTQNCGKDKKAASNSLFFLGNSAVSYGPNTAYPLISNKDQKLALVQCWFLQRILSNKSVNFLH